VLFGQSSGELGERNSNCACHAIPQKRALMRPVGRRYDSEVEGNRLFAVSTAHPVEGGWGKQTNSTPPPGWTGRGVIGRSKQNAHEGTFIAAEHPSQLRLG
jgi:hypothetical protein